MKPKNGLNHLLSAALADFKRNKIRTLLTSLGITIGVFSVIMLIALGLGLKNYIQERFESLGTNLLMIMPGSSLSESGMAGFASGFFGGIQFDEKDVTTLKKISVLDHVVPVFFKSLPVEANKEKELAYIMGTNEEIFSVMNLELISGHAFTNRDVRTRSKNVVLGETLAEKLFNNASQATNQQIQISNRRFSVIGVTKKIGDREMDSAVIMPYKTTFGTLNPDKNFFTIYVGVRSEEEIPLAQEQIEASLSKRYDKDEFSITEQTELLSAINQIFDIINSVLIAIGSISLLVGGIGIMNIMYASVIERTKEVGIRRAIGATQKDILFQFLTESIFLSLLGGLLGLLLASVIVLAIHSLFPASINLVAVLVSLAVSSVIGIFFGVFPARRAANLPPIEAIRYE
jgi:putative ABC transport system permease protein